MKKLASFPHSEEDEAWPALRPYFERIPQRLDDAITLETILIRVREGRMLLWAIIEDGALVGAAATSEHGDDDGGYVLVDALAGDGFTRWGRDVLDDFEQRVMARGFDRLRLGAGRPGWRRLLAPRGYTITEDGQLEKRLSNGISDTTG
ncbi:hypothetical protein [Bauldia sp.]|uniref:hypothetical protein n=1 Tax=Bauldia sp. TaxID=2575872 RepID=UPI003BAAA109